ncbi:hypothetical protein [Leptotrichia massiliensis]|nr:hypothetical protein [Leptotrichia massiliensis]
MGIFDFFKKNKEEEIPLRIAKDFHFHSVVGKEINLYKKLYFQKMK